MLSLNRKATSTIGALVIASSSHAIINHHTTTLSVTAAGNALDSATWNVDGLGGPEAFIFAQAQSVPTSVGFPPIIGTATIGAGAPGTGSFSFATVNSDLANITSNAVVNAANYGFKSALFTFANQSSVRQDQDFANLSQPNAIIGFRMLKNVGEGTTNYGVASITWDTSGNNGVVLTINEWWWNSVDQEGIKGSGEAAPIPEPATTAFGLAALAAGAAGLRRWRKAKAA